MNKQTKCYVVGSVLFWAALAWGTPRFQLVDRIDQLPSELTRSLNAPLLKGTGPTAEQTWKLTNLNWKTSRSGLLRPEIAGAETLAIPGEPLLPRVAQEVVLPEGSTAEASLRVVEVEESQSPLALVRTAKPLVWSQLLGFLKEPRTLAKLFPGKWFDAQSEAGRLHLNVYPLQVDNETGTVWTLKAAEVSWVVKARVQEYRADAIWANEEVIVTSEANLEAAQMLADFHSQKFGVASDIVTVEKIEKTEKPVDEKELPDGFKDPSKQALLANKHYRYETAKKIISYLRARMNDGTTRYVTLVGDATMVPPSYYYALGSAFGGTTGVTDQCYSSVQQCLQPKLALGRLNLRSADEMGVYLSKVQRWLNLAPKAASEVTLYGGKAFRGPFYIGEMGTLRLIDSDDANWRGIQKFHRTRQSYTKAAMLKMVSGQTDSAFVYHLDHGMGNQWYVEEDYVSSAEILAAKTTGPKINPLVVSIACSNAAFDVETAPAGVLGGSSADGNVSVGVALIQSVAGAVAYVGSSRPAIGNPLYDIDKHGNLNITGSTYGLNIMDTFYQKYHDARGGRLGDLFLQTVKGYMAESGHQLSDRAVQYTYLNLALLGDPVLQLPARTQLETNYGKADSTFALEKSGGGFPLLKKKTTDGFEVSALSAVDLQATLLKREMGDFGMDAGETVLGSAVMKRGESFKSAASAATEEGLFFLRLENQTGVPVERQVWFTVAAGD